MVRDSERPLQAGTDLLLAGELISCALQPKEKKKKLPSRNIMLKP